MSTSCKKRILAIGGGGFLMEDDLSAIDDYILALTGKPNPRICFIPTPSGDRELFLAKFYAAYGQRKCRPSHLPFFSPINAGSIRVSDLAEQDAIFVSGGQGRAAFAVWREFGVDQALRRAWENGVVLSGMSAGAIAWFEFGHSNIGDGNFSLLRGLGLLPGVCAVHFNGESARRPALVDAMQRGEINQALALDDQAAVLFEDNVLTQAISWKAGSGAYRFQRDDGKIDQSTIGPVTTLHADGPQRGQPINVDQKPT